MIIGYTSGVYDLFHIGHLNMLRNAKGMCDHLIVGVTTDELMRSYKQRDCIIPYPERVEIVRAIRYVDAVVPQRSLDKLDAWKRLKFDRMFVGDDWYESPSWKSLETDLDGNGVRIVYFPYTLGVSSTLINGILDRERRAGDTT